MLWYLFAPMFLLALTKAIDHPAKRQLGLSFKDACGTGGVDCKNGYCCLSGQLCVDGSPPMCRDTLLPGWSAEAVGYSSYINLVNLDDLTTLGIDISTIPRTFTFTYSTSLPTYTENPIPSQYTPPTFRPDLAGPTSTSTGAASMPTSCWEILMGCVVGVGIMLA